jgi:hypothetical protein
VPLTGCAGRGNVGGSSRPGPAHYRPAPAVVAQGPAIRCESGCRTSAVAARPVTSSAGGGATWHRRDEARQAWRGYACEHRRLKRRQRRRRAERRARHAYACGGGAGPFSGSPCESESSRRRMSGRTVAHNDARPGPGDQGRLTQGGFHLGYPLRPGLRPGARLSLTPATGLRRRHRLGLGRCSG